MRDQRGVRRTYSATGLRRADLAVDPLDQFDRWFHEASESGIKDPTAMALATSTVSGTPSVRIVLLKHYDRGGFCWYSDYRSQKGQELSSNPRAAVLFHWRELERQVRISGAVEKLSDQDAIDYFDSRPEDSRFSAAASVQSESVADRRSLVDEVDALKERYPDGRVPKPENWGGYRLRAEIYEFWQGRESRLHDRFRYIWRGAGDGTGASAGETGKSWKVERLQP